MKSTPRVKRFFSPLLMTYCVAVVLVVGFILYIAFSKTTITITLKQPPTSVDFTYSVSELTGTEQSSDFDQSYEFTDYEATTEDSTARGTVTIVNNYSVAQPLVATTRLLSSDGVLFRTDETITVPAGGEVAVPVYADQPGASGNIGPSRFEIVALWDGLKDNIYGESNTAMTGGVIRRVTMTESLAEEAQALALPEAEAAAVEQLTGAVDDSAETITLDTSLIENLNQTVTPAIGETGDTVVVTTTGTITTIVYPVEQLLSLASTAVGQMVTSEQLTSSVQRTANGLALTGTVSVPATTPATDFIDPASLTGKTPDQVIQQLQSYDEIQDVSVQLSPAWATRTPALEQQIHLQFIIAE